MNNKKGSISISINMIVVVVLAFVMLGLMLTLGQSIVDNASKTANQVSEQTRQDIVNKLTTSSEPLYFTQRQYEINFNQETILTFGVKNTAPRQRPLALNIYRIDPREGTKDAVTSTEPIMYDGTSEGIFQWDVGEQTFRAGEGKPFDVTYFSPEAQGTYQFKFELRDMTDASAGDAGAFVAEQSIFISVR